jgi:hypothetical protein
MSTSKRTLDLISLYSAGLLVGVALVIVIPEGMVTLFEAKRKIKGGFGVEFISGLSLIFGFMLMFFIDKTFEMLNSPLKEKDEPGMI